MDDATSTKTYLGDGVYGEFDGFGVWLTTENGISITNRIYLEPQVLGSLFAFLKAQTSGDQCVACGALDEESASVRRVTCPGCGKEHALVVACRSVVCGCGERFVLEDASDV